MLHNSLHSTFRPWETSVLDFSWLSAARQVCVCRQHPKLCLPLLHTFTCIECLLVLELFAWKQKLSLHLFHIIHYCVNVCQTLTVSWSFQSPLVNVIPCLYSYLPSFKPFSDAWELFLCWCDHYFAEYSRPCHQFMWCVVLCDNFQPAPYGAKHTVYFLTMNVYWADVCLQCSPDLLSWADKVNLELYRLHESYKYFHPSCWLSIQLQSKFAETKRGIYLVGIRCRLAGWKPKCSTGTFIEW